MNLKIINNYVEAINNADVEKLCSLLADDHIFIDSQDNRFAGVENMRQGWKQYFEMFPDYKIEIEEITERDSMIFAFGYAGGTYKNIKNEANSNYWRIPAAWKAVVKDGKIKLWQVYADNSVVMDIVKRNQ